MTSISSIKSLTLDLPPSCIAFCPTQPEYFVVGTYYLHSKAQQDSSQTAQAEIGENADNDLHNLAESEQDLQKRTGSLILFRLGGETITHVITKETDFAILDTQWTPHSEQSGRVLAVATSTGIIAFYKLEVKDGAANLVLLIRNEVADHSVLILSLSWHPYQAQVLGVTLSNGNVSLCENTKSNSWDEDAVIHINEFHRHELEAWTLAFTSDEATNVLSGGDDVVLQCSGIDNQNESLLWRDRKLHQAGITAILPLTRDLVVTGSYDDHIRLISIPAGGRRKIEAELNLGGGVWRLKLLETDFTLDLASAAEPSGGLSNIESLLILASCMHIGSRIVRLCKVRDGLWAFDIVAKFEEHQSMNYGSDIQPSRHGLKSIVSTSFYDRLLCLWQFDVDRVEKLK